MSAYRITRAELEADPARAVALAHEHGACEAVDDAGRVVWSAHLSGHLADEDKGRPYCESRYCPSSDDTAELCDGCRLEAACNATGIGLALAGLCAELVDWGGDGQLSLEMFAWKAGIVLP